MTADLDVPALLCDQRNDESVLPAHAHSGRMVIVMTPRDVTTTCATSIPASLPHRRSCRRLLATRRPSAGCCGNWFSRLRPGC